MQWLAWERKGCRPSWNNFCCCLIPNCFGASVPVPVLLEIWRYIFQCRWMDRSWTHTLTFLAPGIFVTKGDWWLRGYLCWGESSVSFALGEIVPTQPNGCQLQTFNQIVTNLSKMWSSPKMRIATWNQAKSSMTPISWFLGTWNQRGPGKREGGEGGRYIIRKPSLMDSSPRTHTLVARMPTMITCIDNNRTWMTMRWMTFSQSKTKRFFGRGTRFQGFYMR